MTSSLSTEGTDVTTNAAMPLPNDTHARPRSGRFPFGGSPPMGFPEANETWNHVYTAAMVVVATVTVCGNALVVWTILRPRNKDRLRTIANGLLAHQSVLDTFIGGLGIPALLLRMHAHIANRLVCLGAMWTVFASTELAIWGYVLISLERFLLIVFPLRYGQIVSGKRVLFLTIVGALAIFGITFSMAATLVHQNWDTRFGCSLVKLVPKSLDMNVQVVSLMTVESVLVVVMYSSILRVALKHRRQIAATRQVMGTPCAAAAVPSGSSAQKNAGKATKSSTKGTLRCFTIVAVHLACHWPLAVYATLAMKGHVTRDPNVQLALVLLKYSSSALNPFIYAGSSSRLRGLIAAQICGAGTEDVGTTTSAVSGQPNASRRNCASTGTDRV